MEETQFYLIIRKFLSTANHIFWTEWYAKGIRTIRDLLDEKGKVLPFSVFESKYSKYSI